MRIHSLPSTLREALYNLEQDEFIYHVLGENFAEKYIRAKKAEWQDYTMQVTKWEIDQYLYKI